MSDAEAAETVSSNQLVGLGILGACAVVLCFIFAVYRYNVRELERNTEQNRDCIKRGCSVIVGYRNPGCSCGSESAKR